MSQDKEPVLHCDSPYCGKEIHGSTVEYEQEMGLIFCNEDCYRSYLRAKVFETGEGIISSSRTINRFEAVELYKSGRLNQVFKDGKELVLDVGIKLP